MSLEEVTLEDKEESLPNKAYVPYWAKYCKSNKLRCKECWKMMEVGTLTLAYVPRIRSYDTSFYHATCFFRLYRPNSVTEVYNFQSLEREDQKTLQKNIELKRSVPQVDTVKEVEKSDVFPEEVKKRPSTDDGVSITYCRTPTIDSDLKRIKADNKLPIYTKPSELDRQYRSLEPGQMLNDTVVEFYLNYLLDKEQPSKRERIHLFSTFFYAKMKKLPAKSIGNDLDQSVMRWDKNVKLFDKDYLVIPICDCKHWILVIICFANRQPAEDEPHVIDNSQPKQARKASLLIFDSLGHKYMPRFTDPIRNFLNLRWQYERPEEKRRNFKDRTTFTDFYPKVPRQRNTFDCGVYLLHSFEKFLTNPLSNYYQIREGKDFSSLWSIDTRMKRESIKALILLQGHSSTG